MKYFLNQLSNLRHLELQIIGNLLDLCDGHQWATIAEHYRTFDFNFTTENTKIACPDLLLDTFRSSFWLELKSWFIAYDDYPSRIFTVPRFASTTTVTSDSFSLPLYTTIPTDNLLFFSSCITNLRISERLSSTTSIYFAHIKTFCVENFSLIQQSQSFIDLTQVVSLKINDVCHFNELEQLISNSMIRVTELHLRTLPIDHKTSTNPIKSIRRLHLRTLDSANRLYRQFPSIEYLQIQIECAKESIQLRSILKHSPSNYLSFLTLTWSLDIQTRRSFDSTLHWIEKQPNFTYRYRQQHLPTIHLWIPSNIVKVYRYIFIL